MSAIRSPADACTLLDADHRKVKTMFKDYEWLQPERLQRHDDFARKEHENHLDLGFVVGLVVRALLPGKQSRASH